MKMLELLSTLGIVTYYPLDQIDFISCDKVIFNNNKKKTDAFIIHLTDGTESHFATNTWQMKFTGNEG